MCNITYTSLVFDETAQTITLVGTAEDCEGVAAAIVTPHFTDQKTEPVQPDGSWTIVFTSNDLLVPLSRVKSACNYPLKIDARCVSNPDCTSPAGFTLRCEGTGCPSVSVEATDIAGCDNNGQRTVTFAINVSNAPDPTILEINYGDGTDEIIANSEIVASAGGAIPKEHLYDSGSYDVVVNTIFPEDCPPFDPISIDVPPCEIPCPDVEWSADISPDSDCDASGRRTVVVTAAITFPDRSITAWLLNAQGEVIDSGTQLGDLTLVSPTLGLGGGDHDFSLRLNVVMSDDCRPDLEHTVSVPDCPISQTCPTVDWNPDVAADCNPDGTRAVTVSASVRSFGEPITAELRDPQGNPLDTDTTAANGSVTLDSGELNLAPGDHQFTVAFTDGLPRGCAAEDTNTITVPDCGTGPNGEESSGCAILRWLGLILLVVGLVLVIGGACSANPVIIGVGIALAVIGAGLLILWALFCAPSAGCRVFERLIGTINLLIAAFGVIAVILGVIAAIAAASGNPLGLGCVGAAVSDAGYLALLNLILLWIFLGQGCVWQADNPFQ